MGRSGRGGEGQGLPEWGDILQLKAGKHNAGTALTRRARHHKQG